jgi:hypothetical protein
LVPQSPSPAPKRRIPVWAWVVGGCAGLLLLGAAVAVIGFFVFVYRFQSGGLSCLPKDFPAYPGGTYTSLDTSSGTGGSGCTMTYDVAASRGDVITYYRQHLDSSRWQTNGYNAEQGVLTYARTDDPKATGTVTFHTHGTGTEVDIQYRR